MKCVKFFSNADSQKLEILNYLKGKSGVYQFTNTINGKSYIGSSVDLRHRLLAYYNASALAGKNRGVSLIHKALLKYGYAVFSFSVIEIVENTSLESDSFKKNLLAREQYFIDTLNPEYNILKIAGTSSGYEL